ncbi:MAG: alpha/beta hydrolase [Clostridia bacterium]|nr:alpha/beta hydrolase [Clostridia bacterium]MBR3551795.1 alpha/beta hydrolase [Clostridia bacterium]
MKKLLSCLLCAALLLTLAVPAFAASPYPDSAYFNYKDYTLHYRVQDVPNARGQIMFLHGFAESTHSWENLSALMTAAGYRCVLVDLPDFGYSSRETKDTVRLPREEIIHALMTALSDEPWYLAGHSMAGYVTLAVAQTYPESVKNLLLYSTAGNNGIFHLLDPLTNNDHVASFLGPVIELLGRSRAFVLALMMLATMDPQHDPADDIDAVIDPFCIRGTGAGIVYYISMLTDTDYEAVSKMPPILYMNGDRDVICPPLERIPLRQHLPAGSVDYIVRGGGHMFIRDRAEETARVTLAFLQANP